MKSKLPKRKRIRLLHKKLWKLTSLYVRTIEGGKCFTCPTRKPVSECHCGHYYDASVSNPQLNFDLRNLHCQCPDCNLFKSGNKVVYAYNLTKKYGSQILDDLMALKNQVIKWSPEIYEEKIAEMEKLNVQKNILL